MTSTGCRNVNVTSNSPFQDYTHLDYHNLRTYDDSTLCNRFYFQSQVYFVLFVSVWVYWAEFVIFGIFTGLELRYATEVERHYYD